MKCESKDIALKSFFLGPQAENGPWIQEIVSELFEAWFEWRRSCFPEDGAAISADDMKLSEFIERRRVFEARLKELFSRFEEEVPKFSPRYVGHMFSEISLPALLGHLVALLHNPNNISGESARVGVQIEEEALDYLKAMLGFPGREVHGHFTSGGTIANIEALIRARARLALWLAAGASARAHGTASFDLFGAAHLGWKRFESLPPSFSRDWNLCEGNPFEVARGFEEIFGRRFLGPVALVPQNRHYSWKKGISVLGLGDLALWPIELDHQGRLSVAHLRTLLERARREQRPVLLVVSVAGSTELGTLDPVHEVQQVLDEWAERGVHIWHHVDAAYGGFFCSVNLESSSVFDSKLRTSLGAIRQANSVTLDPHKLGYVPYSCGAFLCRESRDYSVRDFGAPYVQNHPGERGLFTLEGSRPATGAAATWMTARSIGLDAHGYGRILERTIRIKRNLEAALTSASPLIRIAPHTDTNILAFTVAKRGARLSAANATVESTYQELGPGAKGGFFVSMTRLSHECYGTYLKQLHASSDLIVDCQETAVIRVCVMNPFFDSKEMDTRFTQAFVNAVLSRRR